MAVSKNPFLKRANEQHEYKIEHIQELKKCSEDPIYFIKNYCQVQHPVKGAVPFKLYPYQEHMIRAYHSQRQIVVLSARQTGKCLTADTNLTIIHSTRRINTVKKVILWIFNRSVYNEIFKRM